MNGVRTQRIRTKSDFRQEQPGRLAGIKASRQRKHVMRHLIAKHRGLCALCGEQVSLREGDDRYATIDHVLPMSKGGRDTPDNYQLACLRCNLAKGCSAG